VRLGEYGLAALSHGVSDDLASFEVAAQVFAGAWDPVLAF